jgi:hypothetical protein
MIKRINKFSLFSIFLIWDPSIIAADDGSITLPSLSESSVMITHRGNIEVYYRIRPEGGEWSEYSIKPGEGTKISCSNCDTNKFQIIINTENKEVNYQLESQKRYIIFWNPQNSLWDVSTIE